MRLAGRGVQRNFRASAQAQPERRGDDWLGRELDGLRHALELADGEVDVVPLFFLHAHEQSMRLAPTEKFVASLVMTKASKSSPGPPGFRD